MRGEVAYLKFLAFPMDPGMAQAVREFLIGPAAQAKAVVIDAREHRGGTLLVMDALLPLLYRSARTLLRMDTRSDAHDPAMTPASATLVRQASEPSLVRHDHRVLPDREHRSLHGVPVLMLTSGRTASAAEHLALALQRSGRGVLIGETTAGAGHFGGPVTLGRFEVFIPIGRTYDPNSGQDWEGRGIEPDIRVPQDRALDHARQYLATRGVAL
jgi:C-terminal processing protease CtpA/Prc